MDKRKHIIGNFQIFQKNIVQPIVLTTINTTNKKPEILRNGNINTSIYCSSTKPLKRLNLFPLFYNTGINSGVNIFTEVGIPLTPRYIEVLIKKRIVPSTASAVLSVTSSFSSFLPLFRTFYEGKIILP